MRDLKSAICHKMNDKMTPSLLNDQALKHIILDSDISNDKSYNELLRYL